LVDVGKVAQRLTIIISGHVYILQRLPSGGHRLIVTQPRIVHGRLAGRPTLIDAYAKEPVDALVIPTDKLRALLIGEDELGERIMWALILRRGGLIETGGGVASSSAAQATATCCDCRISYAATIIHTKASIPRTMMRPARWSISFTSIPISGLSGWSASV
jgi:hypothetical protein